MNNKPLFRIALPSLLAALFLSGCSFLHTPVARPFVAHLAHVYMPVSKPMPLTKAQLKRIRPNEDGMVMILEYHNILPVSRSPYTSTVQQFRNDLNTLYKLNYRPVSMSDYLNNRIALPAGKSPVVLTFDDADASQYRMLPDGKTDPSCAVGVLEAFHSLHPDWALRGTFFIVPGYAFGNRDQRAEKLQSLLKMGFELGNHTITHPQLSHLSNQRVQWELAECAAQIKALAPSARVNTLALPYGVAPRDRALELHGKWGKLVYHNRIVLLAGADPAPAVIDRRFKPQEVPRVQPVPGVCGLDFWLHFFRNHPSRRYVSDGDADTTTLPRSLAHHILKARLNGSKLVLY